MFSLVLFFLIVSTPAAAQTLTVGVYNNSPKIFQDTDGTPRGVFIDLLEYVAEDRGWEIEYRFGSFSELITALGNDEIDILPDTAFTEERARRIRFGTVNVIDGWLQVFAPQDRMIRDARDLDGTRVAVLAGSRQEELLQTSIPQLYGIRVELVPLEDYAQTQQAVLDGRADLLVASRFFAFAPTRNPELIATSVIFEPSRNLYGFRPGIDPQIIAAVDEGIALLQNSPGSEYYRTVQYWLDPPPPGFPRWLRILLTLALAFGVAAVIAVPLLRRSLRSARQSYREIFTAVGDGIVVRDGQTGVVIDANPAALDMYGVAGVRDLGAIGELNRSFDGAAAEQGAGHETSRSEWQATRPDGRQFWAEMSTRYTRIGHQPRSFSVIRDISERKQAEMQLRRALDERRVLLKEVHHRTKNNLQVIVSLLHMQADALEDPRLLQAFVNAEQRVITMAAAHEKLYASETLTEIDAADYLRDLCAHVTTARDAADAGVDVRLSVDPVPLSMDVAIPLGLVMNELVANSVQHGFADERSDARIDIHLVSGPAGSLELRYRDNGCGLSEPDVDPDRDPESEGAAPARRTGLGMDLIQSIVTSQLRGTISWGNRSDGPGFFCDAQLLSG